MEYMHVMEPKRQKWIQRHIEAVPWQPFDAEVKKRILRRLMRTTIFEQRLAVPAKGQKRFGVAGTDAFIPGLERVIDVASEARRRLPRAPGLRGRRGTAASPRAPLVPRFSLGGARGRPWSTTSSLGCPIAGASTS